MLGNEPGSKQASDSNNALRSIAPLDTFKAEMDAYARTVRQMEPLAGFNAALLAGAPEWEQ